MDIRSSLFTKIIAWFILNLVLLAVGLGIIFKYRIGPASPFVGPSETRIRNVARHVSDRLLELPSSEWETELGRFSANYDVTFHLCTAEGQALAGPDPKLPESVLQALRPAERNQPSSLFRQFVQRTYADLNATETQLTHIESAWTRRTRAVREIGNDPALRQMNHEERQAEATKRRDNLSASFHKSIESILKPEQKSAYARINARLSSRPGNRLPFHRLGFGLPRMNDQQLARHFNQADANKDGTLDPREMRRFILYTPRPLPRTSLGRPPERGPRTFMLTTKSPERYWAGVDIPLRIQADPTGAPLEDATGLRPVRRRDETHYLATLLIESDTLGGKSLFSDPLPWVPIFLGAISLSALFWLPMVRNITRPIAEVTAATEQIAEGRFETRVGTNRADEIGRVGQAVDHMADRLAGFVKGQKRFLRDISHELCSPIARIQAALANLEQRSDDTQKKYVQDLREEVEHMSELVDELLMFSRAGMKPAEIKLQPVALAETARRVIDREGAAAVSLQVDIPENLKVIADPILLARALGNLLRNAVRYAGEAGPIELTAKKELNQIKLALADHGPGISTDALPHIFDPFFRPEQARSRDTGGAGLGLSIVKSCIEACGGKVTCVNRDSGGLEFTLTLKSA